MTMAWNDTPLGPDRRNTTQPTIRQNFQTIESAWNVNHLTLGGGTADDGKHLYIQLPEHAAPATAADEVGLYCADGATSLIPELFFKRQSDGKTIAMTEGSGGSQGWTRLPSGLLVKWKQSQGASLTYTETINWGPDFDNATQPFAIVSTRYNSGSTDSMALFVTITIAAQPVMTVRCSKRSDINVAITTDYSFIVIGVGA
jgi:hypothetical protein